MSDPRRLLDGDRALSQDERRALEAGRAVDPPQGAREQVFTSIMATLHLPPGGGGSTGGGAAGAGAAGAKTAAVAATKAASGAGAVALLKSFAVGSALAVAAIVGHEVVTNSPEPPPAASAAAKTPDFPLTTSPKRLAEAPAQPEPQTLPAPSASAALSHSRTPAQEPPSAPSASAALSPAPVLAPSAAPAGSSATDDALRESVLVARARSQLRSGRAGEALSTLDELSRTVKRGVLGQEREALAIEALAAAGRHQEAQARARSFLERFPDSPHAAQVQPYAAETP